MTTTKAGEQPTITQALADELEAVFKRHSLASSYDIQSRVYEVANICLENRKEILNALRTTSLAAQDGLVEALAELRGAGWMVAVHNDYRLCGNNYTFWLFTHPDGRWIKGEAESDLDAVNAALSAIKGDKS